MQASNAVPASGRLYAANVNLLGRALHLGAAAQEALACDAMVSWLDFLRTSSGAPRADVRHAVGIATLGPAWNLIQRCVAYASSISAAAAATFATFHIELQGALDDWERAFPGRSNASPIDAGCAHEASPTAAGTTRS